MPWSTPLEDPIVLPDGRQIVTLADAAKYIQKLPKAEHDLPVWQDAVEALMMAAAGSGPLLHARVGVLRGLNRNVERVFNPDRKEPNWGRPKLKRDR